MTEQFEEFGVRWTDGEHVTVEARDTKQDALEHIDQFDGFDDVRGVLVHRTVTHTDWQPHRPTPRSMTMTDEPVTEDELCTFLYDTALANLLDIDGDTPAVFAVELRRRYTITRKPQEGTDV